MATPSTATSSLPSGSPISPAPPAREPSPIPARLDDHAEPFAGYDRLDARRVKDALSDHSQIELEAVETYERSHEGRAAVLDKLRYLRGSEPFEGYDAQSVEEIVAALEGADMATLKRVRGYERKFANRPPVLDEVARVHRLRRATRPASAAPAYQPTSARSGASARRARKGNGR
jgi:hypothetical protein